MAKTPERSLATRCVHAGEAPDAHGSPHTPVYSTSTLRAYAWDSVHRSRGELLEGASQWPLSPLSPHPQPALWMTGMPIVPMAGI